MARRRRLPAITHQAASTRSSSSSSRRRTAHLRSTPMARRRSRPPTQGRHLRLGSQTPMATRSSSPTREGPRPGTSRRSRGSTLGSSRRPTQASSRRPILGRHRRPTRGSSRRPASSRRRAASRGGRPPGTLRRRTAVRRRRLRRRRPRSLLIQCPSRRVRLLAAACLAARAGARGARLWPCCCVRLLAQGGASLPAALRSFRFLSSPARPHPQAGRGEAQDRPALLAAQVRLPACKSPALARRPPPAGRGARVLRRRGCPLAVPPVNCCHGIPLQRSLQPCLPCNRPPSCSILDIEGSGVPPAPKLDAYLKSRVDKFYAQLAVR